MSFKDLFSLQSSDYASYAVTSVSPEVDRAVDRLYSGLLGPYWEKERRHVEDGYRNIELPFTEETAPRFALRARWSAEQFTGYLKTWSALQTYLKSHSPDEPAKLLEEIAQAFGEEARDVHWPLSVRVWRI